MDGLVVYLNGKRGTAVLRELRRRGHGILTAVTLPRLAHEGGVAEECRSLDIPLIGCDDVNKHEELFHLQPRLGIIAGFSTLFLQPLIDLPELGTINLHGGRLPQYRGGSPLNWQIINGETEAWCSVIRVDTGIDTGDVLVETPVPIHLDDTIADVHDRTHPVFASLTAELVEQLEQGEIQGRVQDNSQARYWHQRNDQDGRINWAMMSGKQVHDLVRAVTDPYPGASSIWDGRMVRILKTKIPKFDIRGVPGRVVYIQGDGPFVICRDGVVLLESCKFDEDRTPVRFPNGTHLN